jgi:SAM-dependent methyltransferase
MLVVSDADAPKIIDRNLLEAKNELERIYYSHKGRRIFKWHHYLTIYDRYLQEYRALASGPRPERLRFVAPKSKLRILEIGVQNGGSLQMWRRYFGPGAIIFGIDIDPRCKEFEEDNCHIRIGDQSDPAFLSDVVSEMGGLDIVIDDGSHIASHQIASFRTLFPKLVNGGMYICEDLHTSYWSDWEGGFRRSGTFIEATKDIIDHLHEWYCPIKTQFNDMNLKTSVMGLHVYDSVVVIEKGVKVEPYAVHVGTNSY